jgi:Putative auto-transporter adhesin, head GIN domain
MKKLMILTVTIFIAAGLMLTTGCTALFHTTDAGPVIEKTYDFTDFSAVEVSDSFNYTIQQGTAYSITVSVRQYLADKVDVHQNGNTLFVGIKNNTLMFSVNENYTVTITMPQLNSLTVSNSSQGVASGFNSTNDLAINVTNSSRLDAELTAGKTTMDISDSSRITGNITAADTQIKVSSSSDLNMNLQTGNTVINASDSSDIRGSLQAADCRITLSSSSTCTLTGSANATIISAGDSSDMNSPGFTLQSADVTLSGSSDASIAVVNNIDISVTDSSTLNYTGNPVVGKISIRDSSNVNHR